MFVFYCHWYFWTDTHTTSVTFHYHHFCSWLSWSSAAKWPRVGIRQLKEIYCSYENTLCNFSLIQVKTKQTGVEIWEIWERFRKCTNPFFSGTPSPKKQHLMNVGVWEMWMRKYNLNMTQWQYEEIQFSSWTGNTYCIYLSQPWSESTASQTFEVRASSCFAEEQTNIFSVERWAKWLLMQR